MSKTERLAVDLPAHLLTGLRESVRSGAFASESEAVEVLLRTWNGEEGTKEPDLKALRAFVAKASPTPTLDVVLTPKRSMVGCSRTSTNSRPPRQGDNATLCQCRGARSHSDFIAYRSRRSSCGTTVC